MEERRRAPRLAESVSLDITEAKAPVQAEMKNLSATGVYCALNRFIPPMTKLRLLFELPGGIRRTQIRCAGVVVRVDPIVTTESQARYHTGIYFTELSDRDRSAITRFVRQRVSTQPR